MTVFNRTFTLNSQNSLVFQDFATKGGTHDSV